jgi:hypothetical protein
MAHLYVCLFICMLNVIVTMHVPVLNVIVEGALRLTVGQYVLVSSAQLVLGSDTMHVQQPKKYFPPVLIL